MKTDSFFRVSQKCAEKKAQLVVVAKNQSLKNIQILLDAGAQKIGFNRVQEAEEKFAHLRFSGEKHFIGHLQSNKATKAVCLFDVLESIDSLTIARVVNAAAKKAHKKQAVFLQINIARDPKKYGFCLEECADLFPHIRALCNISVRGFMMIGKKGKNPREDFEALRDFFRRHRSFWGDEFSEISMGMSADFESALECGASIVRVGSRLFAD